MLPMRRSRLITALRGSWRQILWLWRRQRSVVAVRTGPAASRRLAVLHCYNGRRNMPGRAAHLHADATPAQSALSGEYAAVFGAQGVPVCNGGLCWPPTSAVPSSTAPSSATLK